MGMLFEAALAELAADETDFEDVDLEELADLRRRVPPPKPWPDA